MDPVPSTSPLNLEVAEEVSSTSRFLTPSLGRTPGTAGELVQGRMHNGLDFLVTNPIRLFSEVSVCISPEHAGVRIFPPDRHKAQRAAVATLKLLGCPNLSLQIHVRSSLPVGKGMASSTADVVGTVEAVARLIGCRLSPEDVSRIATSIEPSDGIMYRGAVVYDHIHGQLIEQLGPVPPMRQLIVDLGGTVDTIVYNQLPKLYTADEVALLDDALASVREGIHMSDLVNIGRGATLSARINQCHLQKPALDAVLAIATRTGSYGTACAHSGTILSLLYHPDDYEGPDRARRLLQSAFHDRIPLVFETFSLSWW